MGSERTKPSLAHSPSSGATPEDEQLEQNIRALIALLGEDPEREGLKETPHRARKAWREWTRGYRMDLDRILKSFQFETASKNELVLVRDIPVYSHCEHHLAPFFGVAHLCYVPNRRIIGLSKISRLIDFFARRLQLQERLTIQVIQTLEAALQPHGAGVILECRHLCMESRGIRSQGTLTITTAYRGILETEPSIRAEFMARTR